MRKTLRTFALLLALCAPALAGDIPNPSTTQPPPPSKEQSAAGEIQNGAMDSLAETVLSVIESVLALL